MEGVRLSNVPFPKPKPNVDKEGTHRWTGYAEPNFGAVLIQENKKHAVLFFLNNVDHHTTTRRGQLLFC